MSAFVIPVSEPNSNTQALQPTVAEKRVTENSNPFFSGASRDIISHNTEETEERDRK